MRQRYQRGVLYAFAWTSILSGCHGPAQDSGDNPPITNTPSAPNIPPGSNDPGTPNDPNAVPPSGKQPVGTLPEADAAYNVLTQHNNSARTGAILTETRLNPNNVNVNQFGQLARLPVDGDIYAQPLFARHVPVSGGLRDLVFVATEHNSVYAFDANTLTNPNAPPVWQVNLGPSMPMSDYPGETNFSTEIGITGTPVIDPTTGTMYLVSAQRTVSSTDANQKIYSHWLHALSISDGSQRPASPRQITATVAGTGSGANNGVIAFDSSISLQRTALLLHEGVVYFGASAHGYNKVYHGWFFAYDALTLAQKSVFNTTTQSAQGGIWMSGAGPAVDDENFVYVTTANARGADPNHEHQESLLQFAADANGFTLRDWFTASQWQAMDDNDKDFGSTGVLRVPDSHVAVNGDKSGNLYFLDTRHLDHIQPNDQQCLAKLPMGSGTGFYGTPVYDSANHRVYAWAAQDVLKAYTVSEGVGPQEPVDSATGPTGVSMPGGVLAISADATDPNSGIIWSAITTAGNASGTQRAGVLYAFAANDLTRLLYSSDQNPDRDGLGILGKFAPPTIVNGYVLVATQSGALAVYGLLPPVASAPQR